MNDSVKNLEDSGALEGAEKNNSTPIAPSASPGAISPEMLQWLVDNREDYEFYLLHVMMHDPVRRASFLAVPVTPDDFIREEYALVVGALYRASKITGIIGKKLPNPPDPEFLRTYVESASREEGSDNETVDDAMKLVKELQNPSFKDQHYCVNPYFEAWYGTQRAKKAARKIQQVPIPNVHEQLGKLQQALASASQAARGKEGDPYLIFVNSTTHERKVRNPTGIDNLDKCLNGGWGEGESYLLFGGTGGGKSIVASQCACHEAICNSGYPLIVSTELTPPEYGARIVSCGADVPISLIQDCVNCLQIRKAVASGPPSVQLRWLQVAKILQALKERVYISKVSPDDVIDSRTILEREVLRYENLYGRKPTWVCLDWLGSVADQNSIGRGGSGDRISAWEYAATGCVKFAEATGIPTLVLAQAVNDTQKRKVLTISDIGISKGIGKNMTAVIGLTNLVSKPERQWLCVCKSRKGEGRNIPVHRDFEYQRFVAPPEEIANDSDEGDRATKPETRAKSRGRVNYGDEAEKVYGNDELLRSTDIWQRAMERVGLGKSAAKQRPKKYQELGIVEQESDRRYRIVRSQSSAQ